MSYEKIPLVPTDFDGELIAEICEDHLPDPKKGEGEKDPKKADDQQPELEKKTGRLLWWYHSIWVTFVVVIITLNLISLPRQLSMFDTQRDTWYHLDCAFMSGGPIVSEIKREDSPTHWVARQACLLVLIDFELLYGPVLKGQEIKQYYSEELPTYESAMTIFGTTFKDGKDGWIYSPCSYSVRSRESFCPPPSVIDRLLYGHLGYTPPPPLFTYSSHVRDCMAALKTCWHVFTLALLLPSTVVWTKAISYFDKKLPRWILIYWSLVLAAAGVNVIIATEQILAAMNNHVYVEDI